MQSLSCPTLCDPMDVAHQDPLSMGFSRQETRVDCHALLRGIFLGINELLTEEGILQNGTRFRECLCFHNDADNITCLVFPFSEDVELNVGRLAMWRLGTHSRFGGTWLSDYVPNKLGGFFHGDLQETEQTVQEPEPAQAESPQREKPDCELIGQDGNIFNLMGIASRTLRENGMGPEAKEMVARIDAEAQNYDQALNIIGEYVNITGPEEGPEEGMELDE